MEMISLPFRKEIIILLGRGCLIAADCNSVGTAVGTGKECQVKLPGCQLWDAVRREDLLKFYLVEEGLSEGIDKIHRISVLQLRDPAKMSGIIMGHNDQIPLLYTAKIMTGRGVQLFNRPLGHDGKI